MDEDFFRLKNIGVVGTFFFFFEFFYFTNVIKQFLDFIVFLNFLSILISFLRNFFPRILVIATRISFVHFYDNLF